MFFNYKSHSRIAIKYGQYDVCQYQNDNMISCSDKQLVYQLDIGNFVLFDKNNLLKVATTLPLDINTLYITLSTYKHVGDEVVVETDVPGPGQLHVPCGYLESRIYKVVFN